MQPTAAQRPSRRHRLLPATAVAAALVTTGLSPVPAPTAVLAAPAEVAYPRQGVLTTPTTDEGDASARLGLATYRDVIERLNAAQDVSDRVST